MISTRQNNKNKNIRLFDKCVTIRTAHTCNSPNETSRQSSLHKEMQASMARSLPTYLTMSLSSYCFWKNEKKIACGVYRDDHDVYGARGDHGAPLVEVHSHLIPLVEVHHNPLRSHPAAELHRTADARTRTSCRLSFSCGAIQACWLRWLRQSLLLPSRGTRRPSRGLRKRLLLLLRVWLQGPSRHWDRQLRLGTVDCLARSLVRRLGGCIGPLEDMESGRLNDYHSRLGSERSWVVEYCKGLILSSGCRIDFGRVEVADCNLGSGRMVVVADCSCADLDLGRSHHRRCYRSSRLLTL